MKKIVLNLIFGLLLVSFSSKAQAPSYNQLVSIVQAKLPSLDVYNKIVAINVWSASNAASRETNKEFDKAYKLWEFAKLKNGSKGAVVISCNIDDVTTGNISITKDGITKLISLNKADYDFLNNLSAGTNCVYDNTGTKVYENLSADKIFNSFNQLITR